MNSTYTMLDWQSVPVTVRAPVVARERPRLWWGWRVLARFLIRRGFVEAHDAIEKYVSFQFSTDDLYELVHRQIRTLWRHNKSPARIVIGHKQFRAIVRDGELNSPTMLTITLNEQRFMGLRVTIHPNFDGVLVLDE